MSIVFIRFIIFGIVALLCFVYMYFRDQWVIKQHEKLMKDFLVKKDVGLNQYHQGKITISELKEWYINHSFLDHHHSYDWCMLHFWIWDSEKLNKKSKKG